MVILAYRVHREQPMNQAMIVVETIHLVTQYYVKKMNMLSIMFAQPVHQEQLDQREIMQVVQDQYVM